MDFEFDLRFQSQLGHVMTSLRLRSHWYEYEFQVRVSVYGLYKLHPYKHSWSFIQGQLNSCLPTISS